MTYLSLAEVEFIAREAHAAQTDKAGRPYTEHLQAVADGVRARGGSDGQIAAAWLHDSVEDDALSREWLDAAALPASVKDMVLAVTKEKGEDTLTYTRRILATPGALLVKESDLGPVVWILPGSRSLARTLAALSSVANSPVALRAREVPPPRCLPPPPCDRTHQTPLPDPA